MEPLNATVHLQPDKLEVWLGSQTPMGTIRQAAAASGLKPEQIVIHNCFLGGGFGRRSINDEMRQAILVAKEVGKPVKLVWTREEDMTQDRYRPQAAVRMKAALGSDGMPTAFDAKIAVGSILRSTGINKVENGIEAQAVEGFANIPYAIPNVRVGCMLKNTHVPVMFWRSVGSSQNAFFVESYIDELAQAAGRTLTSSAARCWQASPTSSACSTPSRRRAIGVSRSVKAAAAASLSTNATDRSSARSPRSR